MSLPTIPRRSWQDSQQQRSLRSIYSTSEDATDLRQRYVQLARAYCKLDDQTALLMAALQKEGEIEPCDRADHAEYAAARALSACGNPYPVSGSRMLYLLALLQFVPLAYIAGWVSFPLAPLAAGPLGNIGYILGYSMFWSVIISCMQRIWVERFLAPSRRWYIPFLSLSVGVPGMYCILALGVGIFPIPFAPATLGIGIWSMSAVLWWFAYTSQEKNEIAAERGASFLNVFIRCQAMLGLPSILFIVCISFSTAFAVGDFMVQTMSVIAYPLLMVMFERLTGMLASNIDKDAGLLFGFAASCVGDLFGMLLLPSISALSTFLAYLIAEVCVTTGSYMWSMSTQGYNVRNRVMQTSIVQKLLRHENSLVSTRTMVEQEEALMGDSDDEQPELHRLAVRNTNHCQDVEEGMDNVQHITEMSLQDRRIRRLVDLHDYRTTVSERIGLEIVSEIINSINFIVMILLFRWGNNTDYYKYGSAYFTDEDILVACGYAFTNLIAVVVVFYLVRKIMVTEVHYDPVQLAAALCERHMRVALVSVTFAIMFPVLVFTAHNAAETFISSG